MMLETQLSRCFFSSTKVHVFLCFSVPLLVFLREYCEAILIVKENGLWLSFFVFVISYDFTVSLPSYLHLRTPSTETCPIQVYGMISHPHLAPIASTFLLKETKQRLSKEQISKGTFERLKTLDIRRLISDSACISSDFPVLFPFPLC